MQHAIVSAARSWLGTRFHHQGRLKCNATHKGGVDCLGLLVGVADECNLKLQDGRKASSLDEIDYSHYPDTEYLRAKLSTVMTQQPIDTMREGDVVLLAIDKQPQHLAI